MSAFDDMIAAGLDEAESLFGTTPFTLDGRPFQGVLNEYAGVGYRIERVAVDSASVSMGLRIAR